jgi:hypothetical protein
MKRLFVIAVLLVTATGCDGIVIDWGGAKPLVPTPARPPREYPKYKPRIPRINIERSLRQQNWAGREGEGSCTHATLIMILRHQGRADAAAYWRRKYGDGENFQSLSAKLNAERFRWAGTQRRNDVAFLQWAVATKRGCLVTCKGGKHAILLVHLDKKYAGLVDNNNPQKTIWVSRQRFLSEWFNSNSWGVTILGTPPALRPCS